MEEYEVTYWAIKNTETGLYYRAKGKNRWGKYFNQVSIYRIKGMAQTFCEKINALNKPDERAIVVPVTISEVVD